MTDKEAAKLIAEVRSILGKVADIIAMSIEQRREAVKQETIRCAAIARSYDTRTGAQGDIVARLIAADIEKP